MNCATFRSLIQDLAREDASADGAVTNALAHAESCPACDALLREAEQLTAHLRSLAAQHNFDAAPQRVQAALLEALRSQHAPAPVRVRAVLAARAKQWTLRKTGNWLAVSTVGLAAAALLAILLTGYRPGTSPAPPSPSESAPRQTNRPTIPPRVTWADFAIEGETAEQAAAAYIPLAADFDPSWMEGGAIVRVVLSRPALESFGVPVNGNGEMVADMVISNDGTPEAIRVVNWQAAGTDR